MAENTQMVLTADQKAELEYMQQIATQLGLDANNPIHLEATKATLGQMNALQVTASDTQETALKKGQEKLGIANTLGLDVKGLEAQGKQIQDEAVAAQKSLKTKGIINFVLAAVAAVGSAILALKYANKREWKPVGKWAANIGAFLTAGAGMAALGNLVMAKPNRDKLEALGPKIQELETEFDKKFVAAMAQHFVKEITDEHAHSAAEAAKVKAPETPKHEAPHHQPDHAQPPHTGNTHPHEKSAHEHHEETAAKHEMDAAIREERRKANAALDGATPQHGGHEQQHGHEKHTTLHNGFVKKEENVPATPSVNGVAPTTLMDRVTPPVDNHLAAEAAKAAAATQQHSVA